MTRLPTANRGVFEGFVGGDNDPTGLVDIGARQYDVLLGRFISADPVLVTTDPNQLGGYTYSGDNPITTSDPTGLVQDRDRPGCSVGNGGNCHGYVRPDPKPVTKTKPAPARHGCGSANACEHYAKDSDRVERSVIRHATDDPDTMFGK